MSHASWKLRPAQPELVTALGSSLSIPRAMARVLVARGIEDEQEGAKFLRPRLADLRPPRGMAGLDESLDRIAAALAAKQAIGIFGDYDVDGVTSAALVGDYLARCGADVTIRVARRDEGYGFGEAQARELLERRVALLVLTDCGTSDQQAISIVAQAGVDVIAMDHHRVASQEWPGYALVNPQRPDCQFPFKGLCSAGIAFYAMAALRSRLSRDGHPAPDPKESLDLVALGTLADVAPLYGENRVLVAKGLEALARTDRPGLRELLRVCELEGKALRAEDVGWRIGPRLNAPGRLGDAQIALECLWSRDDELARQRARRCDVLNQQRREIQDGILLEATRQAEQQREDPFILVAGEGWHPGVIGIVAGRLSDQFSRPAAVVALSQGKGRASARSVDGVDLFAILRRCEGLLARYGGHAAAAGFSLEESKVKELKVALDRAAEPLLEGRVAAPLLLDGEIGLEEADFSFCRQLEQLGPHGEGNPRPVFMARDVTVESARVVGRNHLKLGLRQGEVVQQAIGFGMGAKRPEQGERVDVAFIPEIDDYLGPRVQLRLSDVAPAGQRVAGSGEAVR